LHDTLCFLVSKYSKISLPHTSRKDEVYNFLMTLISFEKYDIVMALKRRIKNGKIG